MPPPENDPETNHPVHPQFMTLKFEVFDGVIMKDPWNRFNTMLIENALEQGLNRQQKEFAEEKRIAQEHEARNQFMLNKVKSP